MLTELPDIFRSVTIPEKQAGDIDVGGVGDGTGLVGWLVGFIISHFWGNTQVHLEGKGPGTSRTTSGLQPGHFPHWCISTVH